MNLRQFGAIFSYGTVVVTLTAAVVLKAHRPALVGTANSSHLPGVVHPRSSDPNVELDDYGFGHVYGPDFVACFAPGTPVEYMEKWSVMLWGGEDPGQRFFLNNRWPAGTNGGDGQNGSPQFLRWSFVPDGTTNVPVTEGVSNLIATMDTQFAGQGGRATWVARFQACFDRWQAVSGLTYQRVVVNNDADDGAAFLVSPGGPGLRGDARIAMGTIDSAGGVLAFNYYPPNGDMVLDYMDRGNFASGFNANIFLRNVVMHEHGHGLGIRHVCPAIGSRLMEPFINTGFDGPQHDDIRAAQTYYGDRFEQNDTIAQSTNLTALGLAPGGPTLVVGAITNPSVNAGSALSLDAADNANGDFFKFTTTLPVALSVQATPLGATYDSSPQSEGGACTSGTIIDSLTMANIDFQVIGIDGFSVLATAAANPAGSGESVSNLALIQTGTYYLKVYAASPISPSTNTQLYQLFVTLVSLDCNNNGVADPQDITNGTSQDCDSNGVPDECQVPPICAACADCQGDGIPDICQIPPICPTCQDCNTNGVPDECEIDCNSNGRPDTCDIALGSSQDCQPNGIPDDCEVPPICTHPSCADCNQNGIPDGCELATGALSDCNDDEIPDRCQTDPLLCGGSCLPDCDGNFVPDACQLVGEFSQQSPNLSPLVRPTVLTYTLVEPPQSTSDVTLTFLASGDIDSTSEFVSIDVNGTPLGNIFAFAGFSCPFDNFDVLVVPAATWNAAVNGGDAVIHIIPNDLVDGTCGGQTYINVKVEFAMASGDCNENATLDVCEIAAGTQFDCNGNSVPDSCEIAAGLMTDADFNGRADECECAFTCPGDFTFDGAVRGDDIQYFVDCLVSGSLYECGCADMNADFVLNSADISLYRNRLLLDPNPECH